MINYFSRDLALNMRDLERDIQQFLRLQEYTSCLLLPTPDIKILNNVADTLMRKYQWSVFDISTDLSELLVNVKLSDRSRTVLQYVNQEVIANGTIPTLCINIDLLFEPSLKIDPLQLFRALGRRGKLIVMWPGEFDGSNLSYAVPEHRNYKVWQNPDIQIFRLH